MIDVEQNQKKNEKPFVDEYYRFYVPVRIGENRFVIRIVVENQKKNNKINIIYPNVYDVIIDKKEVAPKMTNTSVLSNPNNIITQSGQNSSVEKITMEEMLRGVQDPNGKNYFQEEIPSEELGLDKNLSK